MAGIIWGSTKDEAGRFIATYSLTNGTVPAINYISVFQNALSAQRVDLNLNNSSSIFKPNMVSDDRIPFISV
jgi:hypothetical protein